MTSSFDLFLHTEPTQLASAPTSFLRVGEIAFDEMKDPIAKGDVRGPVLLTFHGSEVRRWILTGTPPAPLDDVLRGLSAQLNSDALAFVCPVPARADTGADEAFHIVAEHRDGAMTLEVLVRDGGPTTGKLLRIHPTGNARAKPQWLGVPTTWRFELFRRSGGFGGPDVGEA